jgi:hypothetical protein
MEANPSDENKEKVKAFVDLVTQYGSDEKMLRTFMNVPPHSVKLGGMDFDTMVELIASPQSTEVSQITKNQYAHEQPRPTSPSVVTAAEISDIGSKPPNHSSRLVAALSGKSAISAELREKLVADVRKSGHGFLADRLEMGQ